MGDTAPGRCGRARGEARSRGASSRRAPGPCSAVTLWQGHLEIRPTPHLSSPRTTKDRGVSFHGAHGGSAVAGNIKGVSHVCTHVLAGGSVIAAQHPSQGKPVPCPPLPLHRRNPLRNHPGHDRRGAKAANGRRPTSSREHTVAHTETKGRRSEGGLSGLSKPESSAGARRAFPRLVEAALLTSHREAGQHIQRALGWHGPGRTLQEGVCGPDTATSRGAGPLGSRGVGSVSLHTTTSLTSAVRPAPRSFRSPISKMERVIPISPGYYLDLFINAGNILRALRIKAIDHREICSHPVAIAMVPFSGLLLRARSTLGSRGPRRRATARTSTRTVIIKSHREEAHEICMYGREMGLIHLGKRGSLPIRNGPGSLALSGSPFFRQSRGTAEPG